MRLTLKFSCFCALLFLTCFNPLIAQKHSNVWCFGHWAGIDFNGLFPVPDTSALITRGSCATICNSAGQLQFYIGNDSSTLLWDRGVIYNRNHTLMVNGDSIAGKAWYQEHIIIPDPADSNSYYTFSVCPTPVYGLYYSKIDMTLNGGLGAVVLKNVQLQSFRPADCITAIKHGNGRDWWVICRKDGPPNNDFYEYLITPNGVSNVSIFSIGSSSKAGFAKFCVSKQNDKIGFVNAAGLIEIYSFNRCNGSIDSVRTIESELSAAPYPWYWECAFSPNGNSLYVSTNDSSCLLLQFNLVDSNPSLTRDTLWFTTYPLETIGAVRRAPDNKIYISSAYYNTITWNYPYADSMYNIYNMNLSVINQPDSLGAACDFQPYSFYLGGKRTYWGLPNNPDYDLGRDSGSVCDTLVWTGISNIQKVISNAELKTTYISAWQKLFVNAQNIRGRNCLLKIFDVNGRELYSSSTQTVPPYYTQDIDLGNLTSGLYIVYLKTEKENLTTKFVKN